MSELNQLSDMSYTPDALDHADEGAGFNLIVPPGAARKQGVARWLEFIKIIDAYRSDEAGKEGQTRLLLTLQYQVVQGGDSDVNLNRTANLFLRLNPGFVNGKRREALGQGNASSENIMHAMAMKKFKQIMVAAGLGLSQGLSPETVDALFPVASNSQNGVLLGKTLAFLMKDNAGKKSPGGENSQEPENILAAPQGV
jgi:hypothetical protein